MARPCGGGRHLGIPGTGAGAGVIPARDDAHVDDFGDGRVRCHGDCGGDRGEGRGVVGRGVGGRGGVGEGEAGVVGVVGVVRVRGGEEGGWEEEEQGEGGDGGVGEGHDEGDAGIVENGVWEVFVSGGLLVRGVGYLGRKGPLGERNKVQRCGFSVYSPAEKGIGRWKKEVIAQTYGMCVCVFEIG